MENLINNDKLFNLKNININDTNFQYCENVLISLGLSKDFILFNNYYFFGFNDIDNQEIIHQKFKKILTYFLQSGCDHVILGCTELSGFKQCFKAYSIDPMDYLVKACIEKSGKIYQED